MLTIRAATQQDAKAIAHIHVQSWRTTYAGIIPEPYLASLNESEREARWREWLARDIHVFIADLDSEIVGFIGGGLLREPLHNYDAELYTIYLLQQAQGKRIGTALLEALAKSLNQQGFQSMVAWVLEQNPATHFYEKSGAIPLSSKSIEIAGAHFTELAYGWPDLKTLRLP